MLLQQISSYYPRRSILLSGRIPHMYETVIGLEVHCQLLTESKMFCSCKSDYQTAKPNTRVCPVCMGLPGVLPVINRKAVELVIKTGLALDCQISETTKFDRKNYPYPDLMKGYQISQFEEPIAQYGKLAIDNPPDREKEIRITRVHLEEDVAKLKHSKDTSGDGYSLLDINRSGVALMEIVSEPDIRSSKEAHSYLTNLHSLLRFIEVSTANMEEGSFRCDANISIRPLRSNKLGAKVEIKNVNSFRAVVRALEYEEVRQRESLELGHRIIQETRGWSDDRGITVSQRTKEYASDYRYFPEPDLPPINIDKEWTSKINQSLPELPVEKKLRYQSEFEFSSYDSHLISSKKEFADLFDATMTVSQAIGPSRKKFAKSVSNWISVEFGRLLNETTATADENQITPVRLCELLELVENGTLNNNMAKEIFSQMFKSGGSPRDIANQYGLLQISNKDLLYDTISKVMENQKEAIADYINGKETALKFLVGQVMRYTKGKANPKITSEMLKEELDKLKHDQ